MRIAICDDEPVVRRQVAEQILRVYPAFQVQEYASGEELAAEAQKFQIIFLDIRLEGMDGMEAARQIRRRSPKVVLIFLTALEEYVFQAFDVEAFQYLLKPLNKVKFYQVMELAVKKARDGGQEKQEQPCIVIKSGAVTRNIKVDEILYAEVQNRKVTVYTKEGGLEYYGRLSGLGQELGEGFISPHRSYLVNFAYVSSYTATSITMDNGATVPMAKRRYGEFVKQYLQYIKRLKKEVFPAEEEAEGGKYHA